MQCEDHGRPARDRRASANDRIPLAFRAEERACSLAMRAWMMMGLVASCLLGCAASPQPPPSMKEVAPPVVVARAGSSAEAPPAEETAPSRLETLLDELRRANKPEWSGLVEVIADRFGGPGLARALDPRLWTRVHQVRQRPLHADAACPPPSTLPSRAKRRSKSPAFDRPDRAPERTRSFARARRFERRRCGARSKSSRCPRPDGALIGRRIASISTVTHFPRVWRHPARPASIRAAPTASCSRLR